MSTQILEDLKNGKCTIEEAQLKLSQLKKEVTYKISPKGCISFYGIRRLPITVYLGELNQIMSVANSDEFKKFVTENMEKISIKEKK